MMFCGRGKTIKISSNNLRNKMEALGLAISYGLQLVHIFNAFYGLYIVAEGGHDKVANGQDDISSPD